MERKQIDYKKKLQKELEILENKKCVDCGMKNPRWVSVKYGVMMCLDCAGAHRSLGVYLDFVKSATLDSWNKESYLPVKYGGNKRFLDYLKERNIQEESINDRYRNKDVMEYAKIISDEIEAKCGIKNTLNKPKETNYESSSSEEIRKQNIERAQTAHSRSTNSISQKQIYSQSNQLRSSQSSLNNIANSIKSSLTEYSPKIINMSANISSTTLNTLSGLTTAITNGAKTIGNKTISVGNKVYEKVCNKVSEESTKKKNNQKQNIEERRFEIKPRKKPADWS